MAQRLLNFVASSRAAPRVKTACEVQARETAPAQRSEALGSSHFHAANASATQLAPAAARG